MKPVEQTVTGEHGNCMSACLASLLEIPIEQVPNFYDAGPTEAHWWQALYEWLARYGYGILNFAWTEYLSSRPGYLIVSGKSTRGLFHATIWKDGKLVHDPHPDKTGIEKPEEVDMLYPLDPGALRLHQHDS